MSATHEGWAAATRMLAIHMISIGGVVVASHRTLATYLAVTSLPRPIMPPRPEEVEQPANSSKVKAFLTKPRVKKTLMVIFGIVATLALWAAVTGVFVALFRFTSQIVLDLCLVSLFGGFFTWTLWRTLEIGLSLPTSIAYKAQFPKATEKSKRGHWMLRYSVVPVSVAEWYRNRRNVIIMSTAIGSAIMLSAACGIDLPLIVLPATWIVPVVSSYHFPRMSMRRASQIMLAYISFIIVLSAIIVPIAIHFGNKQNAKTPEQLEEEKHEQEEEAKNWTLPSAWIGSLLDMTHYLYIIAGPGIFIAMNWRFDYTQQHSAYLGTQSEDSDDDSSRLIPALYDIPTFAPNASVYAIASLIVSVIGLTGTFTISEAVGEGLSGTVGLVVVVPIMLSATAFGAWRNGVLNEWWNYSELWVPTPGDEATVELGNSTISVEQPTEKLSS